MSAAIPATLAAILVSALAAPTSAATHPPPTGDDVPPFVGARGDDAQLSFAVTGLAGGFAQVGAGVRQFAVCWQGGKAPFTVSLRDASARTLVLEGGLNQDELVEASKTVAFTPGPYYVHIEDSQGSHVDGQFAVVAPGDLPAADGGSLGASAEALAKAGLAWRYEAYLRVVPAAVSAPGSATDQLARTLCHRP